MCEHLLVRFRIVSRSITVRVHIFPYGKRLALLLLFHLVFSGAGHSTVDCISQAYKLPPAGDGIAQGV